MSERKKLIEFLDRKVEQYNQPSFIPDDPVSIPHSFTLKQDIEIAGLFAAVFAWGNRTTIINKSRELFALMNNAPFDFIRNHSVQDLKKLTGFKHRTFNTTDLLYFIEFFQYHYSLHDSLEAAFTRTMSPNDKTIENALNGFHIYFLSLQDIPARTRKHVASPANKSTCKRLCMFMRWMVRNDNKGVDFGLWKDIMPSQLVSPVDVHVARVAKRFGVLHRTQIDWQAALELTAYLRTLDKHDPVKYDYALFGLGAEERF